MSLPFDWIERLLPYWPEVAHMPPRSPCSLGFICRPHPVPLPCHFLCWSFSLLIITTLIIHSNNLRQELPSLFVLSQNFLGKLGMFILPNELEQYLCEVETRAGLPGCDGPYKWRCPDLPCSHIKRWHPGTWDSSSFILVPLSCHGFLPWVRNLDREA